MMTGTADDFIRLFTSARADVDGPNALTSAGLDDLADLVIRAMDELPPEYEEQAGGWAVRVWLSELLIEAAQINRDRVAAQAQAAGETVGVIAAAMGQPNTSNARRRAPYWRAFYEATKAADLARTPVPVEAGRFLVHVDPQRQSDDDPQSRQADA
jgi:hypothetical protein